MQNQQVSFRRTWREKDTFLGEKSGKKHRKNGLLKIGSFLTKSFLNFFSFSEVLK
jgi:hypothetical protein